LSRTALRHWRLQLLAVVNGGQRSSGHGRAGPRNTVGRVFLVLLLQQRPAAIHGCTKSGGSRDANDVDWYFNAQR